MSEQRVERAPHASLAQHVEQLWDCRVEGGTPNEESVLPSGTTELVFDLRDATRPAFVCGPHAKPFTMKRGASEAFVGVHFRPAGAAALLGVAASEIANTIVSLDDLWGRPAAELRERLAEAPDAGSRLRILEACMRARSARARQSPAEVRFALAELERAPAHSIGELCAETGVSARRFIAMFAQQVGLTPKLFERVRRFHGLLRSVHAAPSVHWTTIAHAAGYYDQAHLSRDFREFSGGFAPGEYLRRRGVDPNHVAA